LIAIRVQGVDELIRRLRKSARSADPLMKKATREVLEEDVLPLAQREVPVDTGALLYTIRVILVDRYPAVVAGGIDGVDYAVIQHENLSYAHPNGGKAKFIEDPMMSVAGTMDSRIAKRLNENELMGGM
jgi:hypothetical protein